MSSASTPSPSFTSAGKCVVCGKETWMRCSACSKAGLDWMCFCSTEHQKLIWSIHKRVCGVRSNPYHWPGFTSEEIEEMLELCVMPIEPVTLDDGKVLKSWLDLLGTEKHLGIPLELKLHSLRQTSQDLHEPRLRDQALPLAKTAEIVTTRANAHVFGVKSRQYLESNPMPLLKLHNKYLVENLFNGLANTQRLLDHDLPRNPQFASWWTVYQHKHLLYNLLVLETARRPDSRERWTWMCRSKRDLIKFCEGVIKETHPKLAADIAGDLINVPRFASAKETAKRKERAEKARVLQNLVK